MATGAISAAAKAGIAYFAAAFAAGFALGTVRVLLVEPVFGELPAILAETPLMLAVSFVLARAFVARFAVAPTIGARLAMGGLALALLLLAEAGVGIGLIGQTLPEHLSGYLGARGAVTLFGQGLFGLMPLLLLMRTRT